MDPAVRRALGASAAEPGVAHVREALRILGSSGPAGRRAARWTASVLASAQTPDDLAVVFVEAGTEELRTCLVHELVLRGTDLDDLPGATRWARSPRVAHHPLAWLPLRASEVEAVVDLPSFSAGGSSVPLPYASLGGTVVRHQAEPLPPVELVTTPEEAGSVSAAVQGWAEESNGRVVAEVLALGAPVGAGGVPVALLAAGLECWEGVRAGAFDVLETSPQAVWRVLFAAASNGGAYGGGESGAYGRLAAWRSLAGLAGAPGGASFADVERRVLACGWFAPRADTSWFDRVVWDLAAAALHPDGRRIGVLAATDTD